jgi:hypothetical protein
MSGLVLLTATAFCQQGGHDLPRPVTAHAVLMSPLTTGFSQKGDTVSVKLLDPPEWKGAMLEGDVQTVQKGGGNKHAAIQFTLQTRHQDNQSSAVAVSLLRLASSRAQKDHDDEGVAVEIGSESERKSPLHLGFGRDHGSDKNGSGSIKVTSGGPDLTLAVGTSLELQILKR